MWTGMRTLRARDLACILIIKEENMRALEKSFEGVENFSLFLILIFII